MGDLPPQDMNVVINDGVDITKKATVYDVIEPTVANTDNPLAIYAVNKRLRVRPGKFIAKFALDGASADMNVDGSSTAVTFDVTPSSGKIFYIHKLVITMEDSSINFTKFAGIAGGLTNGFKIEIKEGGDASNEVLQSPFKKNSQFSTGGLGITIQSAATDLFIITFSFEDVGTRLSLTDSLTEFIRFTVQDDLTSILQFKIVAQGFEVSE